MTANDYESIPQLDCSDGCRTLGLHKKKTPLNYTLKIGEMYGMQITSQKSC